MDHLLDNSMEILSMVATMVGWTVQPMSGLTGQAWAHQKAASTDSSSVAVMVGKWAALMAVSLDLCVCRERGYV